MILDTLVKSKAFFARMRDSRLDELAQAERNPHLHQALERDKLEGHRISTIARTLGLLVIALFLPFVSGNIPNLVFNEAMVLIFILIGWLQLRVARVGQSRTEMMLILLDFALMTLMFIIPRPFIDEQIPSAMVYRFDNFIYFFVLLAVGTLAYSWRTVWSMGTIVAAMWMIGIGTIFVFGTQMPQLSTTLEQAFPDRDLLVYLLEPNTIQLGARFQEMIVFIIVATILALKSRRFNQLLLRQADIAEERANLSRYFPPSMVDLLASTNHDVGAVRNQPIAVMFTDIVGFTQIAEQYPPEVVMAILRRYHSMIEGAIFENGGTLDKYLGDGVMATFGTPTSTEQDASNALRAAQQIISAMDEFRAKSDELNEPEFTVSVGVHFGNAILGDIGPSRRLEFAVIGDTVNVAARLEAASRELGCKCVVSDELVRQAEKTGLSGDEILKGFTRRENVKLRGRSSSIDVWMA